MGRQPLSADVVRRRSLLDLSPYLAHVLHHPREDGAAFEPRRVCGEARGSTQECDAALLFGEQRRL